MLILMIIKIILANKQIPQKQQQETNERTKGQSAPKAKLLKAAVLNTFAIPISLNNRGMTPATVKDWLGRSVTNLQVILVTPNVGFCRVSAGYLHVRKYNFLTDWGHF